MQPVKIATWSQVPDREPVGALVDGVDLVIVRFDDNHSVLYGRCLHRGALMCDGRVEDDNLICGLHGWDYVFHTGVSSYGNAERLTKFSSWVDDDDLFVDAGEIAAWSKEHPQPFDRDAYQGAYQDPHGDTAEPLVGLIRRLANERLDYLGHHGPITSMGVERDLLPKWEDIQFVTAQLAGQPQPDDMAIGTDVVIGPNADKPLLVEIPLLVSDISFGALSQEAKVALARGAELAGTGICSGEGECSPRKRPRALGISMSWLAGCSVGRSTRSRMPRSSTSNSARAPRPAPGVTGGLRTHTDFDKALVLGADAVAVSNSAMQAIGCLGMWET
jgi:nitrite reductase/ring-hydroxylating ferredoxin subunit